MSLNIINEIRRDYEAASKSRLVQAILKAVAGTIAALVPTHPPFWAFVSAAVSAGVIAALNFIAQPGGD